MFSSLLYILIIPFFNFLHSKICSFTLEKGLLSMYKVRTINPKKKKNLKHSKMTLPA